MQRILFSLVLASFSFLYGTAQPSPTPVAEEAPVRQVKEDDVQHIFSVIQENICNPAWLETPEWQQFATELQSEALLSLPLDEFQRRFNQLTHDLPFTHLRLHLTGSARPKATPRETPPDFELKALNEQTALLTVREFVADAPGMMKIVQEIQAGGYDNLVIDLRDNPGGTLDAAVVLGRFLTNEPIDAGVYLTRKWFLNHADYPTAAEIQQFPYLQDMTYGGIMKAFAENEAIRMVLPPHDQPTFGGKIAVLTSDGTGSTCEPFVDLMKRKQIATVVGRRTYGGMLSGGFFAVNDDLKLFLPIADFLNEEGVRIDRVGVAPDVDVPAEEALEYVLEHLF
jgi:hypothetical protein